jgi:2-methylcitrate dehydratase PrpD
LVLELTGKIAPKNGLEGKFSVYHACAAGLIFGFAGEREFQDDIVNRADVVALRQKIIATVDPDIAEAAADVTVRCSDGRELHQFIENAVGSLEEPMTDEALDAKFDSLTGPALGSVKSASLRQKCWNLAAAESMDDLLQHALP